MDEVALANYFAGYGVEPDPIEAWRVDPSVARALDVPLRAPVRLSYANFSKITLKHRDITFDDLKRFAALAEADETFVARDRRRSAQLVHDDAVRPFKIVLHATRKDEVYLVTFHRINISEARRLHKRAHREGRLIRDLKTKPARF
jgi:hypothetical protein